MFAWSTKLNSRPNLIFSWSAKISSSQIMYIYNHYALYIIIAQIFENLTFPLFMAITLKEESNAEETFARRQIREI